MRPQPDPLARFPAAMRARLRSALRILLEAFDSAAEFRGNAWDTAVRIADLRSVGVRVPDLRWLIAQRYARAGVEETEPGANRRVFSQLGGGRFPAKTCFFLTDAGAAAARRIQTEVPFYDREKRELWARGELVKRFTQPAPDQETILLAFQELGWPRSIDDPLPKHPGQDAKERLRGVIFRLNQHQRNRMAHFRSDGTGQRIIWEFTE
jgi:hypothetical protein